MKNPLQSKAVVASLIVIAGLVIAANVVKFPVVTAASHGPSGTPVVPPSETTQEKFEIPPRLMIREQLVSSYELLVRGPLARDPFRWSARAVSGPTNAVFAAPSFKLQGVSIDADKAFAVLNRRVVGVGEKLDEYVVERIFPTEVWMRGPAGRLILRLAR